MGFLSKFEGKMEDTLEGAADHMVKSPISPVQIAKKAEKKMRREKMVGAGKQYAPTLYTVLVNADDDERLFGYYPTLAGETETYLAAKAAEEGLVMDGQPLVRFIVDEGLRHGKFDVIAEAVAAPLIAQLRQEEMERYGLAGAPSAARGGGAPYGAPAGYGAPAAAGYGAPAAAGYAPAAPYDAGADLYGNGAAPYDPYAASDPYAANDPYDPYAPAAEAAPYGSPAAAPFGAGMADPYAAPVAQDAFGDAPSANGKPPLPYVPEDEIDYSIDYGEYTFDSQNFEDYRDNGLAGAPLPNSGAYGSQQPGFAGAPDRRPMRAAQEAQDVQGAGMGAAGGAAAVAAGAAGVAAAGMGAAGAGAAPNTVVFAAGVGAATPQPSAGVVRARLVDTTNNRTYALATARLVIGRESSCDITLPDINVSRAHAELRFEPQGVWSLTDLGSTNGTFVNGREIGTQLLREGDHITIGMTNLVFDRA